jgi:hypothetical protein
MIQYNFGVNTSFDMTIWKANKEMKRGYKNALKETDFRSVNCGTEGI